MMKVNSNISRYLTLGVVFIMILTIIPILNIDSVSAQTLSGPTKISDAFPGADQVLATSVANSLKKNVDDTIIQTDLKAITNLDISQNPDFEDWTGIGYLTELRELLLYGSPVTGKLSDLAGMSIGMIDLSDTNITGNLSDLSETTDIKLLYLTNLNITGELSDLDGSVKYPELYRIDLCGTQVTGDLSDLSNFQDRLNYLGLSGDSFTGDLSDFTDFGLQYLYLIDTSVTGDLSSISNMAGLNAIDLSGSPVSGNISSLQNNQMLEYLYFMDNDVTGTLSEVARLFPGLLAIDFSYSPDVSGTTADIADLPALSYIYFEGNTQFTGDIAEFAALNDLNELYLNGSSVSGDAGALTNLQNLTSFDLSDLYITEPELAFVDSPITVPIVDVKDDNSAKILPDEPITGGSYSNNSITWAFPGSKSGTLEYTFGKNIILNGIQGEYSGTVIRDYTRPIINSISADPKELPSKGGDTNITVKYENIRNGVNVAAFDKSGLIQSKAVTLDGDNTSGGAIISLPANSSKKSEAVYTIKASLDGKTWIDDPTATVTVAKAVKGSSGQDESNNTKGTDKKTGDDPLIELLLTLALISVLMSGILILIKRYKSFGK